MEEPRAEYEGAVVGRHLLDPEHSLRDSLLEPSVLQQLPLLFSCDRRWIWRCRCSGSGRLEIFSTFCCRRKGVTLFYIVGNGNGTVCRDFPRSNLYVIRAMQVPCPAQPLTFNRSRQGGTGDSFLPYQLKFSQRCVYLPARGVPIAWKLRARLSYVERCLGIRETSKK